MSNKLSKAIKNKLVTVGGFYCSKDGKMAAMPVNCIITNDEVGKTLSVGTDGGMFIIPFEPIEKYLH